MKLNWKRLTIRFVKLALVALIVGGLIYWFKFSPIPVTAYRIESGTIVGEVMGTGTLEARVEATVSPKIAGRIVELLVDQGERVAKGDLLVRLDDEELEQQVAIAAANVDAAMAAIERLKADKDRAIAVYEQARRSDERIASLATKNAASREDEDKATEALAVAESGVSRAEAAISEGQKELVSAEKTAQYHQARLKDTLVHAPFDGMIVRRNREPGDVVVPGSSILTLISTDELWISAWVDETEMARLAEGQTARILFRSEPENSYTGQVARLGRQADRETREFIVDVRVLELPKNWAIGQRAETYIQVAQRDNTLILPTGWIVNQGSVPGAMVDVDGAAVWKALKLGVRRRDAVEVLAGLAAGDVVVSPVTPGVKLRDGRRIAIREDTSQEQHGSVPI